MKKVFWGVLLSMANLASLLLAGLALLLPGMGAAMMLVVSAATGLITAAGYYMIYIGAGDLPQTQNWEWVGKTAKILCAYTAAITVVDLLPLTLPNLVITVLTVAASWGSFLVMYLIVLGTRDLQYSARVELGADKLYKTFLAYVVLGLLASLVGNTIFSLARLAAYIVMLVLLGQAARKYEQRFNGDRF